MTLFLLSIRINFNTFLRPSLLSTGTESSKLFSSYQNTNECHLILVVKNKIVFRSNTIVFEFMLYVTEA